MMRATELGVLSGVTLNLLKLKPFELSGEENPRPDHPFDRPRWRPDGGSTPYYTREFFDALYPLLIVCVPNSFLEDNMYGTLLSAFEKFVFGDACSHALNVWDSH